MYKIFVVKKIEISKNRILAHQLDTEIKITQKQENEQTR